MSEYEPQPEQDQDRLALVSHRFESFIIDGITRAHARGTEIDLGTARLIGHVLGRALGRESQLAEFGRTGDGNYESLRDEYLRLYNETSTPPMIKEWIDWLGTYLVAERAEGTGRRFMNESLTPSLERVLVRTRLVVGDSAIEAYAPASLTAAEIVELGVRLESMGHSTNPAFLAFLSLSDVNAAASNLVESFEELYVGEFPSVPDALRALVELAEWERDLQAFGRDRGIQDALKIDLDVIESLTREIYDLVERGGRIHAFHR